MNSSTRNLSIMFKIITMPFMLIALIFGAFYGALEVGFCGGKALTTTSEEDWEKMR